MIEGTPVPPGDGERPAGPGAAPDARAEAIAPAGREAGKILREIAIDRFGSGSGRVAAEWNADGWMRARAQWPRRAAVGLHADAVGGFGRYAPGGGGRCAVPAPGSGEARPVPLGRAWRA